MRLRAIGEAEAIRNKGKAKADAYRVGVEALGIDGYTAVQLMQIIGEQHVRVVPDVSVSNGSGMADGLMAMLLRNQLPASNKQNNKTTS